MVGDAFSICVLSVSLTQKHHYFQGEGLLVRNAVLGCVHGHAGRRSGGAGGHGVGPV